MGEWYNMDKEAITAIRSTLAYLSSSCRPELRLLARCAAVIIVRGIRSSAVRGIRPLARSMPLSGKARIKKAVIYRTFSI